ncbi:NYN domain-containing protein [Demequina muriae]|uniref:NYN domain-containing protein n=1 Tax=Demequina muriae TaxID=3051664 RepID=A0ABT8GGV7_9MICO|nr:NYN domain-containing protein [Demequina sp. EGI L300058]MDN4480652.1 NYN domain-containing protein [Demequina sp. EGI L300058]
MTRPNDQARLAVLIDADNAHAKYVEALFVEIAKYGTASVRRAYGDWTTNQLKSWKDSLLDHSVQPVQQFSYTQGKNSTDSALIIDAMDLLHGGTVDGFCLVSSDSDFTRLAARIREQGFEAYGFGERKTPKPFVAACNTFVYVENLIASETPLSPTDKADWKHDDRLDALLKEAVTTAARDDDWAHLGEVGSNLSRLASDFDSRTWGFSKLKDLMSAHPAYEINPQATGEGRQKTVMVRLKAPKKTR